MNSPGSQTISVEDVTAGQLLSTAGHHLLPADDADVVRVGQLLARGVGVERVHVVDRSPGENDVVKCFLEGSHGEVHRAHSEQGQGVDADHDDEEEDVEQHFDKTNKEFRVEHEDSLVLPGVLTVEVDRVEDVLDEGVDHDGEQDGVLEAEHELDAGALGEGGGVGVLDEEHVQRGEDQGQGEDPQVEEERDDGRPLHVVHPVLRQPVERLEEQQQGEQGYELGGEIVPELIIMLEFRNFFFLETHLNTVKARQVSVTAYQDLSIKCSNSAARS